RGILDGPPPLARHIIPSLNQTTGSLPRFARFSVDPRLAEGTGRGIFGSSQSTEKRKGAAMITAGKDRRGAVLIYSMLTMIAFVAFCSLAVDYGHIQYSKTEL